MAKILPEIVEDEITWAPSPALGELGGSWCMGMPSELLELGRLGESITCYYDEIDVIGDKVAKLCKC